MSNNEIELTKEEIDKIFDDVFNGTYKPSPLTEKELAEIEFDEANETPIRFYYDEDCDNCFCDESDLRDFIN